MLMSPILPLFPPAVAGWKFRIVKPAGTERRFVIAPVLNFRALAMA
jgi:hypothetical protein